MQNTLTPRETQIRSLIIGRHSPREIAGLLGITIGCFHVHKCSITKKLGRAPLSPLVPKPIKADPLSPRQREIMDLRAEGMTFSAIAIKLRIRRQSAQNYAQAAKKRRASGASEITMADPMF